MCIQVWSADAGVAHSPPSDLLWKSQASWGTGSDIVTALMNSDGEVKMPTHDEINLFSLHSHVPNLMHRQPLHVELRVLLSESTRAPQYAVSVLTYVG